MTVLCDECGKRDICQTLCPEAELYANQDYVAQSELTVSELESDFDVFEANIKRWPGKHKPVFTPKERKILERLLAGKDREQIAQELRLSRNALRKHFHRIHRKAFLVLH